MKKTTPLISVVMPFYNAAAFLDESIQSILKQTFRDFELILINDASSDNSDEVVQKYLSDTRVRYICNDTRTGIVVNLNRGVSAAKAELIARMDGDDISQPERFQRQYDYMSAHKDIALLGSYVEIIDENGVPLQISKKPTEHEDIKKVCFYYGPFVHPVVMFRKSVVENVGGYRGQYELTEDIDLFFRIIYEGYRTANLPEVLLKYRQHGGSTSRRSKEIGRKSFRLKKEIVKKYKIRLSLKEHLSMYIHYMLDMTLTGEQKRRLQLLIKGLIDR